MQMILQSLLGQINLYYETNQQIFINRPIRAYIKMIFIGIMQNHGLQPRTTRQSQVGEKEHAPNGHKNPPLFCAVKIVMDVRTLTLSCLKHKDHG